MVLYLPLSKRNLEVGTISHNIIKKSTKYSTLNTNTTYLQVTQTTTVLLTSPRMTQSISFKKRFEQTTIIKCYPYQVRHLTIL